MIFGYHPGDDETSPRWYDAKAIAFEIRNNIF
ncbi:hypothetical protein C803_05008 [Parabacteroides goldsteinii dnLKV18]|uniref:Uncharacterized protein n=1 Tax=Parabacteroides goldsteinii dnLKV18 TaxID=1235789 RepID=S0GJ31_9BACT|nr:hypothetical protein C803_05008 [Parabacteroides goldsteinii dnLKV18]